MSTKENTLESIDPEIISSLNTCNNSYLKNIILQIINYHPDIKESAMKIIIKGDWPPQLKKSTFNTLSIVANDALQHMNFSLFIHALSSYYARLFKDCIYISYRKAKPGKEATAISTVPKDYQELMYGLLEILEGRMKYEDFWNGDLDLFQKIVYVISELRLIQSLEALCG